MFARRFFPARFFAPRYFPPVEQVGAAARAPYVTAGQIYLAGPFAGQVYTAGPFEGQIVLRS